MIERAVVVGAGTMGSGIAQVLATGGLRVTLVDVLPAPLQRAEQGITRSLGRLVERGTISALQRDDALARIAFATTLDDHAVSESHLAIEAVVEERGAKQTVLRDLAARLPADALLASNTSSISITALGAATARPAQVVGMHFFNPAPLMPLVEVVRGQLTADDTVAAAVTLAEQVGKQPVVVHDYPGFAANRILLPMLNEAFFALMEGVADKEAIDQVMKLGMNHPMGPLELADLIGLDVCLDILEVLHRDLGDDKYRPCPLLRRYVAAGRLGRKTGAGFYNYPRI